MNPLNPKESNGPLINNKIFNRLNFRCAQLCYNTYTVLYCRVEWFLKKNLGTCHVVVDCSGTSNPKFYFELLLFHPAHGKTRPQKTPKIPEKGLKSAQIFFYLTFYDFIRFHLKQNITSFFKAKKEEKIFVLLFFRSKTIFAIF